MFHVVRAMLSLTERERERESESESESERARARARAREREREREVTSQVYLLTQSETTILLYYRYNLESGEGRVFFKSSFMVVKRSFKESLFWSIIQDIFHYADSQR